MHTKTIEPELEYVCISFLWLSNVYPNYLVVFLNVLKTMNGGYRKIIFNLILKQSGFDHTFLENCISVTRFEVRESLLSLAKLCNFWRKSAWYVDLTLIKIFEAVFSDWYKCIWSFWMLISDLTDLKPQITSKWFNFCKIFVL